MTFIDARIVAGGVTPPATIKVWDRFVRVFHWSLAVLFVIAFATGDEVESVHIAAGYAIAALVVMRVGWGLVGPDTARFSHFVRPPREVLAYLADVAVLRARRYVGHNPAGGAMVVALLVALALTAATGIMMTTDAFWGAKWVEEVHEVLASGTVVLIVVHVVGVLITSLEQRENLIRAMITGLKRRE